MRKIISTAGLSREDWLRARKLGIGGSDAGAVVGLDPYKSAMTVYYDKTGDDIEVIDNEAMRQGREFEQYVAMRFCEETGKKVRRANGLFCHDDHDFMIADFDRLVVGENAGLECKTCSPYSAEKWMNGNIPLHYQIQVYHYMAVMDADAWYIAVLIYGREFKFYRIERDLSVEKDLINIEKRFWEENVMKRVIPEPDGSDEADAVIARHFRDSRKISVPLIGFDDKIQRRQQLIETIGRMETEKKQIEQELKMFLGDAEEALGDRYTVSWKKITSLRIDPDRLKAELPDIYQKYQKESSYRRLTIKAA